MSVLLRAKPSLVAFVDNLSGEAAAYLLSIVIAGVIGAAHLLLPGTAPAGLTYIPLLISSLAFIFACYIAISKSALAGWAVKATVAVVVLIASTVSIGLSRQLINNDLGVPADAFPLTVSFAAAALMPLAMAIVIFVPAVLSFVIASILVLFPLRLSELEPKTLLKLKLPSNEQFGFGGVAKGVCRLVVIFFLLSAIESVLKSNDWYTNEVSGLSKAFAFNFESERFSYCEVDRGQRVAYVGDGLIVVGQKTVEDAYSFRVTRCKSDLLE